MRILFLISSMRGGGAERVASTLCNHWAEKNYGVVLVTFDEPKNDFYVSDDRIKRYTLNCFKTSRNKYEKIKSNLKRIYTLRKIIKREKPDVVVSFMDVANMLAVLSTFFLHVPVIISERTFPQYFNDGNSYDKIRKTIYKYATCFVAQTTNVANWAHKFLSRDRVTVIPNPIQKQNICIDEFEAQNVILAVGRLCDEKGFDMLIQAFSLIHQNCPDWILKIVGEGDNRQSLQELINHYDLQNKVLLPGQSSLMHLEYAKAKIFVLSSRVEGFPNVLLEAMANGLPAISFDCNSGPKDIIRDGENGLLVPANDVDELAKTIEFLVKDEELRNKFSRNKDELKINYGIDKISEQWVQTMVKVVGDNYGK